MSEDAEGVVTIEVMVPLEAFRGDDWRDDDRFGDLLNYAERIFDTQVVGAASLDYP